MKGTLFIGEDLKADVQVRCDVCIIGSGAGGSVLAEGLTRRGLNVVMLEEGGYFSEDNFRLHEADAYFNLYQDRGTRATEDVAITVLQGRNVGGGTTVNWTTCFRTPDRILDHWERVHGVKGLHSEVLAPHFDAVEERLGIKEWPLSRVNNNNKILLDGCGKLGWEVNPLRRNVRGCADSGYCGMGCPIGAKQAMHRTYLQDALDLGLRVYSDVRVTRLNRHRRRIERVEAEVLERATGRPTGVRVVVHAKVVVSSCGAINGPALLLRSGLNENGWVGRRTMLHPAVALPGIFDRDISPFYGAPQSVSSHEFIDRGPDKVGFFLESAPVHPVLGSLAFGRFGAAQGRFLGDLSQTGVVLALAADGLVPGDEGGVVSLRRDGRTKLTYPLGERLQEMFHKAHRVMTEIHFNAGAHRVVSLHVDAVECTSLEEIGQFDRSEYGSLKHAVFSAHQMGGCLMGEDPKQSVVDSSLLFHGLDNLFVVDGSVFPTGLGVNPSETIYALAHRAAEIVAERI